MSDKSDTNKKIKVTLRVNSNERVTIPPLGEMLLEKAALSADGGTTTTTITNGPRGTDSGADSDTDM